MKSQITSWYDQAEDLELGEYIYLTCKYIVLNASI